MVVVEKKKSVFKSLEAGLLYYDNCNVFRIWIRRRSSNKYRPTNWLQLDVWATYNRTCGRHGNRIWPTSSRSTLIWFWPGSCNDNSSAHIWPAACCNDHRIHVWPANCNDSFRIHIWSARSRNHYTWIHVWPTSRHHSGPGFWLWPASSSRHWLWRIRCTDDSCTIHVQLWKYL